MGIKKTFALALAAGALAALPVAADDTHQNTVARPDDHAPIGVMGDHLHAQGEFMLSYRYMRMRMDGNREGTNSVGMKRVLLPRGRFPVAPTDMNMQMHMLGAMWAPHDRVTLMAMLPYVVLDMDHQTATGVEFTTRAKGIGDVSLTALAGLWDDDTHALHANLGFSFPSGSIDRKDDTPASMGRQVVLPYPMQVGSGTVDFLPGLTYNGTATRVSWGGQARGVVRIDRNDQGYRQGHRYALTSWGAVRATSWLSTGLRLEWEQWGDVQGRDGRINKNVVPTADPDLRGGMRLDIGPSINLIAPSGFLSGVRFAVEMLFPVYEDLEGPQLETDWKLVSGFQYAF